MFRLQRPGPGQGKDEARCRRTTANLDRGAGVTHFSIFLSRSRTKNCASSAAVWIAATTSSTSLPEEHSCCSCWRPSFTLFGTCDMICQRRDDDGEPK